MSQGLAEVLAGHGGRLDVQAAQQRPVARHQAHGEELLGGPLLLPLFGSSVLEPNLLRRGHGGDRIKVRDEERIWTWSMDRIATG